MTERIIYVRERKVHRWRGKRMVVSGLRAIRYFAWSHGPVYFSANTNPADFGIRAQEGSST